jgi:hypothetical protein
MELTVAGDVAVELATRDDLDRHHERLRDVLADHKDARYYMVSGATANTAAQPGPIAMSFTPQAPPPGRIWRVQWAAIWQANSQAGLLAGAIANLFAALCVGNSPTGPGGPSARAVNVNASDIAVPGQTVPSSINVPDLTVVKSEQQLYFLIGGSGLTSVNFSCTAGVLDAPDVPEALFW